MTNEHDDRDDVNAGFDVEMAAAGIERRSLRDDEAARARALTEQNAENQPSHRDFEKYSS